MWVRIASAAVASAVFLTVAGAGGWWFGLFAVLILGIGLAEYFAMALPGEPMAQSLGVLLGVGLAVGIVTGFGHGDGAIFMMSGLIMGLVLWSLAGASTPKEVEQAAVRIGRSLTGVLWIGGLGSVTSSLVLLEDGFAWLVMAGLLAFGSDGGGYFIGRQWGRYKLSPEVSPQKTWEGAIGGVVVASLLALGWWKVSGLNVPAEHLVWVAPLVSAVGQVGDLAESLFKRSVGAKDSGAILPGHGGVFDRIDALLFVGPPLFFFARWGLGVEVRWLQVW
ncbi:MAG: phosphatidate cytidylyltransferase [Myxococcales bacterium]|nr:phosphatidate cytidylyltransferase [Myxococcales bacterium]